MKNTKIMNKHFILGAALLTAVLMFGSCKNDTTNINDIPEQEKQGLVVGGSFALDGALPKQLALASSAASTGTDRSAVPSTSFDDLNEQEYEYVAKVFSYSSTQVIGKDGKPTGNATVVLELYQDAVLDVQNKTWSAEIFQSGDYLVQVFLIKAGAEFDIFNGKYNSNDVIFQGQSIPTTIEVTSETIKANFNKHFVPDGWNTPIKLLPNLGYTEETTDVKINLKFRFPATCDVSTIEGIDANTGYALFSVEKLEFETSGVYKIGTSSTKAFLIENGYYSCQLRFYDSNYELIYSAFDTLSVIPGLITDTWTGDGPYTTEAGVTYFDITQQMLDDYKTAYNNKNSISGSNKYPVILFDKTAEINEYSVFNTNVPGNATLSDGITLSENHRFIDYAIAPLSSIYGTAIQKIFTVEDSTLNLVMYPSYAGYGQGYVVTSLRDSKYAYSTSLESIYVAEDGYVYVLISYEAEWNGDTLYELKRVKVSGGVNSSGFGEAEVIAFSDNKTFKQAIFPTAGQNDYIPNSYKIAVYKKDATNYFIYLMYINNQNLCCTRIDMPSFSNGTGTVNVDSEITRFEKSLSDITLYQDSYASTIFDETTLNDVLIIPSDYNYPQYATADMYVLISSRYASGNQTYTMGGVVKISNVHSSSTTLTYVQVGGSSGSFIKGWKPCPSGESVLYPSEAGDEKYYFFGPTRFVARKPDELVIADEQSYAYGSGDNYSPNNTDRVVTVSLANFASADSEMTSVPVQTNFNWSLDGYCGSWYYAQLY